MRTLIFSIGLLLSSPTLSEQQIPFRFVRNYDGDTISVVLSEVQGMDKKEKYPFFWYDISVRIKGIDAPEIRGKCPKEKELAKKAKKFVFERLTNAKETVLSGIVRGKYFRLVAETIFDGRPLGVELIKNGFARPYDGKRARQSWCSN